MKEGIEEGAMLVLVLLFAIFMLHVIQHRLDSGYSGGADWIQSKFKVAK